jgi:hypothetical protein
MKYYFHCDVNMYRRRVRMFLEYTAIPALFAAVLLTVCLLLSLRNLLNSGLLLPAAAVIGGVVFAFALLARIMLEVAEHRVRVHSRYTYIEIGLKDVIVSLYAGNVNGCVYRRLIVIPLEGFNSAESVSHKGRKGIVCNARGIRDYTGNTDRLGYYFVEGELRFTEFYYNEGAESSNGRFSLSDKVFIPDRFGNRGKITTSVVTAKKRYDALPPEKGYVFREMEEVRVKRIREKVKNMRNL